MTKKSLSLCCIALLAVVVCAFLIISGLMRSSQVDEHVVIEFWTHEDANRAALEDRYAAEFMELHPNVEIRITRQSSTKLIELVQTALRSPRLRRRTHRNRKIIPHTKVYK